MSVLIVLGSVKGVDSCDDHSSSELYCIVLISRNVMDW